MDCNNLKAWPAWRVVRFSENAPVTLNVDFGISLTAPYLPISTHKHGLSLFIIYYMLSEELISNERMKKKKKTIKVFE